ncbi:hypothetical protein M407DRAFT_210007 [Tulasnella calospora MUT 4182]|uniref:Aminotransferase class I/classII large domain-containing protein n=1 Tax=Tulasnella calospora MUT 4182 TaxID=1051891 RepID=A0A0C3QZ60_9AGAM|nr:hypothetical protein M407DRAFT_210007 [Tulasnella calospora MUT 4182]
MVTSLERRIADSLDSRASRSILRRVDQPPSAEDGAPLIDFSSNDYLSLSKNETLRERFLEKLSRTELILGSGGSRLLDGNTTAHFALETRLKDFFNGPAALLFNSGFDANVALFSTLPQPGDIIIIDSLIHASVWDGCRASRAREQVWTFEHNSMDSLERRLKEALSEYEGVRAGETTVFVGIETLYSMDGDFAPLREIVDLVEKTLPRGNGFIIADEAHATGLYGPRGRGLVASHGLEDRIPLRLHTFGKALASNGAVVICSPLIRSYLCNYARSLIFTTALSHSNVISIGCSFDLLEDGTSEKLSKQVRSLCMTFVKKMVQITAGVPMALLSIPRTACLVVQLPDHPASPIIPLLTTEPRPLASYLQKKGYLARPITWPTVPKGQDRVRICIHAGNTEMEVIGLVDAIAQWATDRLGRQSSASNARL